MMRVSLPRRFSCLLAVILTLFSFTFQANAGVRIKMVGDLEPARHFLVTTQIYNAGLEQLYSEPLDSGFLTSGESRNITVLAVKPLFYDHVSTDAIHPAYYIESARSDAAPHLLRTVVLPILRPQSWRHLLDSGEPPKGRGGSSIPGLVNHHFYVFLSVYLPAFDRARIKEDLRQYLPLLRELAAFAHRERRYKESAVAVTPGQGPIPLPPQEGAGESQALEHYRRELDARLDEITSWLALEQGKRASMHDWMDHFQKADYVYREMMTDADRTRLQQWLDRSLEGAAEQTLLWTNPTSGLRYTANLTGQIGGDLGGGLSVDLTVDLNPILGVKNDQRYLKRSYSNFYRNAEGMWKMK